MPESATKKSPFCGAQINAQALKCRFCMEKLESSKENKTSPTPNVSKQDEEPSLAFRLNVGKSWKGLSRLILTVVGCCVIIAILVGLTCMLESEILFGITIGFVGLCVLAFIDYEIVSLFKFMRS